MRITREQIRYLQLTLNQYVYFLSSSLACRWNLSKTDTSIDSFYFGPGSHLGFFRANKSYTDERME